MTLRQMIEDPTGDDADDSVDVASYPSAFATLMVCREPALSTVERNVVRLARRDTLASIEAPGLVERAIAWTFGLRGAGHKLADPRLETLRRAVVVTRHRRHLPDPVAVELRAIGLGEQRIRAIEALALSA